MELEAYTTRTFSGTSTVTSTQIGTYLTQMSALIDGINNVDEGHYGTDTTCDEWVKQAVLAACSYKIAKIYALEVVDPLYIIKIIKSYCGVKPTTDGGSPSFNQDLLDSAGGYQ